MKKNNMLQAVPWLLLSLLTGQGCTSTGTDVISVTGTDLADTLRDNTHFTGIYKSYHPDGYLYSEVSYREGKKDGISKRYYADGKVHSVVEYSQGKKTGVSKWLYTSGEVYRITPYTDGMIDGVQKKYYRDGTLQAEIPYSNGNRKVGLKEYNSKGMLLKSYPEIVIQPTDRRSTHGRYSLAIRLSNEGKNVKFYLDSVKDSLFIPDGKNFILTEDGVGMIDFVERAGAVHSGIVHITALYRTPMGNSKILQKTFRLPSTNLVY